MLYVKNNTQVFYNVAEPIGKLYYDLYNFTSMSRTPEALQTLINLSISQMGLSGLTPTSEWKYALTLDFLGNAITKNISVLIDQFEGYLKKKNQTSIFNDSPLKIVVENIDIKDVLQIIEDNEFQSLNNMISSLCSSVWRVSITSH